MSSLVVLLAVVAAAVAAPAPQVLYAYGPLAQPANAPAVLIDAHGRPLDTAEVVSARALHLQAKALEGHVLRKRSLGHAVSYSAVPAAVSHQSRVDVRTSPAYGYAAVAPAPAVYSAPVAYAAAPAAVSHQSRVDYISSPAVVAAAPAVVESRAVVAAAPAVVEARTAYVGASAVSHQSRVDVETSPAVVAAAPVAYGSAVYSAPAYHSYSAPLTYASAW